MIKKSLVILLGSPRKDGNSTILAEEAVKGAKETGAVVHSFYIHGMNIKFCNGCFKCRSKTSKNCVIDDDMQSLYPKLRKADAILFASPVYWANISGQMKVVLDRCFALSGPEGHDMENKQYGVILTYGNTEPFKSGTINAVRTFQDSFQTGIIDFICANVMDAGEINSNPELVKRAFELGRRLVCNDP